MTASCTPEEAVAGQHEDARRSRREKFALRTIKADFICRLVMMAVRLISIPMAIRLLGNERYGLWLTAGSLLTWINLSQLGLGGGLVNELGRAFGGNDRVLMRRYISTAYCCVAAIAVLAFLAILAASRSNAAIMALGVRRAPYLAHDARVVFLITGALLAATLFANTIVSVTAGLQESYLYSIFFLFGNVASLGVLAALAVVKAGLPAFTWGMGFPPVLLMGALTVYFFGWRHPHLTPAPRWFDTRSLRTLLNFGAPLLVAQLGELMIFNSATPLIASRLGLAEVPRYAVAWSLFMIVVNVCDGIVRAYLGGYCEAAARHDWQWMRQVAVRTRKIAFGIMALASISIAAIGPYAIRVWAGKTVIPSSGLLAWMGLYCFLMVCSNTNTVLLLGLGHVRLKAGIQVFVASVHILGFFALAPRFGVLAIPIAGTLGYLGDITVSYLHTGRYLAQRLEQGGFATPKLAEAGVTQ